MLKGEKTKALRRRTSHAVVAHVSGNEVPTWYFSPSELKRMCSEIASAKALKPVGSFIPPSYLNPFFKHKPIVMSLLERMDYLTDSWSFLSSLSDHFLLDLKLNRKP
jgi:hypothetical protein